MIRNSVGGGTQAHQLLGVNVLCRKLIERVDGEMVGAQDVRHDVIGGLENVGLAVHLVHVHPIGRPAGGARPADKLAVVVLYRVAIDRDGGGQRRLIRVEDENVKRHGCSTVTGFVARL